MTKTDPGTFTCENCGGTYDKIRSDEEADAEFHALIPDDHLESGRVAVCHDCWLGIMGRIQIEAPELLAPGAPRIPGACYRTGRGHPVHVRPACRCPR